MGTRGIRRLSKKVTKKVKDLAVLKWKLIVENQGRPLDSYSYEIDHFRHNCSLCHVFISENNDECNGCPFDYIVSDKKEAGCGKNGHIFDTWAMTPAYNPNELFYATKILDFLENLKVYEPKKRKNEDTNI